MKAAGDGGVLLRVRLAGEGVLLRPISSDDVDPAFEILHERAEVLRWLVWDGPRERADVERLFRYWAYYEADGSNYELAVCEPRTGAFLGALSASFRGHRDCGVLGYWLAPERWGQGIMTEAVRLAAYLGFRHLRARALAAYVFAGNHASRAVLEKNAFELRRTLPQGLRKHGRPVDAWYFELERERWERANAAWSPVREEIVLGE